MSRTKKKTPQEWTPERANTGVEHPSGWNDWWYDLYLQFVRGQRPGKEACEPRHSGGWYGYYLGWRDIPGRNCAGAKWFEKKRTSKMRRREVRKKLRGHKEYHHDEDHNAQGCGSTDM